MKKRGYPLWKTLLWMAFQLAIGSIVFSIIEAANDRDHVIPRDSLAPGFLGVAAAFLATLLLSILFHTAKKAWALLWRKKAIAPTDHGPLSWESGRPLSSHHSGQWPIASQE